MPRQWIAALAPNGLVHRAAHLATKPIGYEKPLRVQPMLARV